MPAPQTTSLQPNNRAGNIVFAASPLLWIAQAAVLALAVQRLADHAAAASVVALAATYAALGIARATGDAWAGRQLFKAARQYVSQARAQACAALARNCPMDRTRPASGQAASAVAEQAQALLLWQQRYQPARLRVMLVPPVIALVVGSQSWLAALILLVAAPLIPLAMALIGWCAKAASEEQLQALGGMNGFLLDRLRGLTTLRSLGAVDATAQRLRVAAESLRERTMRVLRIAFLSSAALELFSALAVALVAVYIGFHLLGQIGSAGSWGQPLTLAQGLFILLLAPAFFEPLRELSAVWHDRAAGQAALEALGALRRQTTQLPGALGPQAAQQPAQTPPAVDIHALSFAHANEAAVFQDAELHIAAGEHIALVGASGAGKTTLLSMIAGLAPAPGAQIWIGGTQLNERSAAALRSRIAWIDQKPHIFTGTVHENIALQRPGISRSDVLEALSIAGLAEVAHLSPQSSLSEGGVGLSGGEAVRLALARACVAKQTDLWLLDEPTAHLDSATAQAVTTALLHMAQGRTLIVATHDMALAAQIGRVIHIEQLHANSRRAA